MRIELTSSALLLAIAIGSVATMTTAGQSPEMTASFLNGQLEVRGFYSGVVEVKDLATSRVRRIDLGPGAIWNVGMVQGRFLVAGRRLSTVVYDIDRDVRLLERPEPLMGVAPDGSLYFVGRLDPHGPALVFYRSPDGPAAFTWPLARPQTVNWFAFSSDLRYVVFEMLIASERKDADVLVRDDHRKARQPHYSMLDLVELREVREFVAEEILYRGHFDDSRRMYVLSQPQLERSVAGGPIGSFDLVNRRWMP